MSFLDQMKDSALESLAPNTMALAREIEQQAANNPAQAQALESLTAALKAQSGNVRGISTLEKLLGSDAKFKGEVRALALQNPAALEKILPQALSNHANMKSLVAQTAAANGPARPAASVLAAATPQAAPAPQAAPKAQSTVPPAQVEAKNIVLSVAPAAAAAAAPKVAAQNSSVPRLSEMSDLDKLAELSEVAGYNDLMDRIKDNPDLGVMFDSLMSGSEGDPAARTKALDDILRQTRKNPDMLSNLVDTIDEKPGVVSSIAGMAANDPKMAMTALGMYSQFNQGFGKMLDGLFGPGVLDKLLVGLMGAIAPMLSNSNALMLTSNNGGSLTRNVMNMLGGAPAEVHSVAPENGEVVTRTGEDFKKESERKIAEAQNPPGPQQNRNLPAATPVAGPQPAA